MQDVLDLADRVAGGLSPATPPIREYFEQLRLRGRLRVTLTDARTGALEADSGWFDNLIVNNGWDNYIIASLAAFAGAQQINYLALSTRTTTIQPTDTTVTGEVGGRKQLTATNNTAIANRKTGVSLGQLQLFSTWTPADLGAFPLVLGAAATYDLSQASTMCSAGLLPTPLQWTPTQNVNVTYAFGKI